MSRLPRPHRTVTALLAAATLTLAGCSDSGDSQEFTASDTEADQTTSEETQSPAENTNTENEPPADPDLTEVDPARFEAHGGYIVSVWDAGLRGCGISMDGDIEEFQCAVDFFDPPWPYASDRIATGDGLSTAVEYDPVHGFFTVSDRFAGAWQESDVPQLEVDETVTIGGFSISRIDVDAVLIERGAHWFYLIDGDYYPYNSAAGAIETDPAEYVISDSADSLEGAICGYVETDPGVYSFVMSMEDGTDCPTAFDVAEDYISPNRSGEEPQGSGGFWDGPHGWSCGRGYLAPGMEDTGANKMPVCSAENLQGVPGEGSGSVAIVPTPYLG